MNGLNNITFPTAGIDLIQHEVRVNLFQVLGKDEEMLETLTFQGRMLIERGTPFKNREGFRQIDFIVKSWVATAWSRTLKQDIVYILSENVEQPMSSITSEKKGVDYPAKIEFNVTFDIRANNKTIKQGHKGKPAGHDFRSIPPALEGFGAPPSIFTFGDDDIVDLGVGVDERGELRITSAPKNAKEHLLILRIKPVDCNDKAGRTLVSFVKPSLPVPSPLINEMPYIQHPRLNRAKD